MALFAQLANLADQLAVTSSRLQKRALIAQAIAAIHAVETGAPPSTRQSESSDEAKVGRNDAGLFALYLAGQPFAQSDPRKLNAGGALTSRLLRDLSHATDAALSAAYRRHGDLGAAAFDLLQSSAPSEPTLTLTDVAAAFDAMASARTTAARTAAAEALLRRATALEAKYLFKLILGDMRIGVQQSLVEEAIAAAASTEIRPIKPAEVRHAVMLEADLARAVSRSFNGTLAEARMTLFHPLGFMLASPVATPEEAIARFTEKPPVAPKPKKRRTKAALEAEFETQMEATVDESPAAPSLLSSRSEAEGSAVQADTNLTLTAAFLEDKYDGMRAQLHCGDPTQPGRVALYSRNKEDITESYPELAEAFAHITQPLILDGEVLAWSHATHTALPFATLGQRIGRKRVGNEWRKQIPVIFMAFDLLYAGGELLLPQPLSERRHRLESLAEQLTPHTTSPLELDPHATGPQSALFPAPAAEPLPRLFLSPTRLVESAADIDRAYSEARARANEGVMLKRADSAYLPGRRGLWWLKLKRELATLDVVITAAEFGHGKRAPVLSDYTFAVRDDTPNAPTSPPALLNVGKAYSGLTDAEIAELTAWLKAHTLEDHGHSRLVEPQIVLEVAFNNIMRSARHASGFALRFPRILRIRTDKPPAEIDTLSRVEEIYLSQIDRPVEASD